MADDRNENLYTDDECYRTFGTPATIRAFGRAMWNFLSLEGLVADVLHESGQMGLSEARALMAGPKADALNGLIKRLRKEGAPPEIIQAIRTAHAAFDSSRDKYRNALAHAHPFTAGYDDDGADLSGLAYTKKDGSHRIVASDAQQLLDIAHEIEDAIDPLAAARKAVQALPK
jgi:hypothetical protein